MSCKARSIAPPWSPWPFDRGGQPLQRCILRQVGQVILCSPDARRSPHKPDLVAGKVLAGPALKPHLRPIRHSHAAAANWARRGPLALCRQ